jgi:tetratricopeptide (TPR) repeat protein
MSTDRWARLRTLFDSVCDLPDDLRATRLAQLCDDPALRIEVEALVAAQTANFRRASRPMGRMLDSLIETELKEGDRLGAWRLLERLGSGGMGAVFRAERCDGQFEQRAAVKLLRGLPSASALDLLARERQILARLDHPGIARLFDGGTTPAGLPYLVMEFIEGEPVDVWCRTQGLGLRERLVIALQIADALAHAHRNLVLHCDLKPSNVMVRREGQPILLDFGVARLLDQPGADGVGALTPSYAAPELLAGAPPGVATDVYGLGRLLAELLLDRRLVAKETEPPLRLSRLAVEGPAWRRQLTGDLDLVVATATAPRVEDRYPTVEALASDLRRWLDRRPLAVRGRAPLYRLATLARRRAPLVAALAVALVAVGLASWRIVGERDRALAAERIAIDQARAAEDITQFLVSLFEAADPRQHGGEEPSVRMLLDLGAARLLEARQLDPVPRARLTRTLAGVYGSIGLPDRERDWLKASVEMHEQSAADVREHILTLSALVTADANGLRLDSAEEHLARARELLASMAPRPPLLVAELANSEGLLRMSQRRMDDARASFQLALDLRREHLGNRHIEIASVLHNLGLLEVEAMRPGPATAFLEASLDIKHEHLGIRHPSYLLTLETLGRARRDLGEHDLALELVGLAAELRVAIHGEHSIGTHRAFNELGAALHDAGRFEDAEHAYQRSLRIAAAVAGETSFEAAVVMNNLAFLLQDVGRLEEAESLFRRSLDLREQLLPENDPRVLRLRTNLATLLAHAGRSAEARELLTMTRVLLRDAPGATQADLAHLELRLAGIALDESRRDDAWAHLSTARELDPEPGARNRDLERLVSARLELLASPAHALLIALQALELRTETLGSEIHPGRLPWVMAAAEACAAAGDSVRSRKLLDQAREIIVRTQAPNSPWRVRLADLEAGGLDG